MFLGKLTCNDHYMPLLFFVFIYEVLTLYSFHFIEAVVKLHRVDREVDMQQMIGLQTHNCYTHSIVNCDYQHLKVSFSGLISFWIKLYLANPKIKVCYFLLFLSFPFSYFIFRISESFALGVSLIHRTSLYFIFELN